MSDAHADIDRFVLASDLDGTLIDHDTPPGEADEKLADFAERLAGSNGRLRLWFNSSRPVASQRQSLLDVPGLPTPEFQIGAMGTQVCRGDTGEIVEAYGREQFGDWPRDVVEDICVGQFKLVPHADEMQTPFKASYDLHDASLVDGIKAELEKRGVPFKVVVSSGKDLDVLPPKAGKASAIQWLVQHGGLAPESVVVSGDSANDLDMFVKPFRGIVVGNGHDELKRQAPERGGEVYLAKKHVSAGVVEGLLHFGVLR